MNAATAIHATLDRFSPHVPRGYRVTLAIPGANYLHGDRDLAITYPVGIKSVEVPRFEDPWTGTLQTYHRDSVTGQLVYSCRVRYEDGAYADGRFLDARERDEFAFVMRTMREAA